MVKKARMLFWYPLDRLATRIVYDILNIIKLDSSLTIANVQ